MGGRLHRIVPACGAGGYCAGAEGQMTGQQVKKLRPMALLKSTSKDRKLWSGLFYFIRAAGEWVTVVPLNIMTLHCGSLEKVPRRKVR